MQRSELLFLSEMVGAIQKILSICSSQDVQEVHQWNHLLIDSLLWNYTVLGEAAAKLPASVTEEYPEAGWRHAVSLRNRIVHGYWSVDLDILIDAAENDLPKMLEVINRVIAAISFSEDPRGAGGA